MWSKNCLKIVLAQNCLKVVPKLPQNCLKVPPKFSPSSIKVIPKLSSSCVKEVSKSCQSCVKMWQSFFTVVSLLSQVVPKLSPNISKLSQNISNWCVKVVHSCLQVASMQFSNGAKLSQVVASDLFSYSHEMWWVSVFDLAAVARMPFNIMLLLRTGVIWKSGWWWVDHK